MRNNRIKKFSVLIAVLIIIFQVISCIGVSAENPNYMDSVKDMITEYYGGTADESKLDIGTLKGIFGSMDPYTTFFSNDEAKSFFGEMEGSFEGIGITIEKVGEYLVIIKVFSDSPAEKAGLLAGDIIMSADGVDLVGASTEEAVSKIKGPSGTKVVLGVKREGKNGLLEVTATRALISIDPVAYEIRNDIGYIKLDIFNANAYTGVDKALAEMDRNGITKIVLDLRDNPGGEVDQAVAIARRFIPAGVITTLDFKSEKVTDQVYTSNLEKSKYKLAVLVNENSASASEILAGAIQDTKVGTLIGSKTFGKAKVQNLFPILSPEAYEKYYAETNEKIVNAYDLYNLGIIPVDSDIIGWAKLTTGYYYTPKNRMIDLVGLEPDIKAEAPKAAKGVNVNTIERLTKTSNLKLNSEGKDVYNAEKILKAKGYNVDTPDTKLDSKTYAAVKKFQKDYHLKVDGIMGVKTQTALNQVFDKLILQYDPQYAKAVEVLSK